MNTLFTVQFSSRFFFCGRTKENEPLGSPFPSIAKATSYLVAAEIARRLQQEGYSDAVVCTRQGMPALPEDIIKTENPADSKEFHNAWGND